MLARRLLPVALLLLLVVGLQAQSKPAEPAPPVGETVVYVTKTGEKYHAGSCRYLRQSRIAMKLKDAALRFGPCSVCKPPTLPR